MKCPHCKTAYNEEWDQTYVFVTNEKHDEREGYYLDYVQCPECKEIIIDIIRGPLRRYTDDPEEYVDTSSEFLSERKRIYPISSKREIGNEIPKTYRDEYSEAISIVNMSPKASAALSRRIVQLILREELKIRKRNLSDEIDFFISKTDAPSYLKEAVDAIRNIGNFAAHPSKSNNTGEIVEVENSEAEWLLEVIEALFDFVFVQPSKLKKRKEKLNKKLSDIGKPPMKDKKSS